MLEHRKNKDFKTISHITASGGGRRKIIKYCHIQTRVPKYFPSATEQNNKNALHISYNDKNDVEIIETLLEMYLLFR